MSFLILFWVVFDIGQVITESPHSPNYFLNTKTDIEKGAVSKVTEDTAKPKLLKVRKCCAVHEYYSTETHKCVSIGNDDIFKTTVIRFLLTGRNQTFLIHSEKIDACPKTYQKPDISYISDSYSHSLVQNGNVQDHKMDTLFDDTQYCLEMVGGTIEASSLAFVYCLNPDKMVPKCCPKGHYFDLRVFDCSAFYSSDEHEGDSKLLPYLTEGSKLMHKEDFTCNDPPVKINLSEARLSGNMLCVTNIDQCNTANEYCIDNMLNDDQSELTQSAYVCPENFINKCCPAGSSLHKDGCIETSRSSLLLAHILHNSRYHVKSISQMGSKCNPVTIEKSTRSDTTWTLNSYGFAEIKNNNDTIQTRNYCIDDFVNENEVFPIIKLCSEEVKIYHEVSSINVESQNTLGKCCPGNKLYRPHRVEASLSQCIEKPKDVIDSLKDEFLQPHNISHLVYTSFPNCSTVEYYHKYELGGRPAYHDYAELSQNRTLKIIRKDNSCKIKETQVHPSKFCFDFVVRDNDKYNPVVVVCIGNKNSHRERNAIVVALVGISCAALISTFFSLIFMRVRRGMVTMKKINTLAGRILTSYVLSQLLGYLILGIGILADFKEDAKTCFTLAGFLMFFLIAAFCWNTSICLEGLLLTMHIQMSDSHRYIYHSVWAWGLPSIFTAAALIKDFNRDTLPCDAITPKFGLERCFFSDPIAQLLYFYFPIGITVIVNGVLLVSARIIRKRKMKKLEKDPNRVRHHETLQQVLSIKSIKSKLRGEPSIKPISSRSGLRMHQNRNIWLESLKLVLWSGTTWLMEIIGTLVTMYLGRSQGEWYQYLWYFPMGFNCLRGLGIFVIISFNSDNKSRVMRTVNTFITRFASSWNNFFPRKRRDFPSSSGWRGRAIKCQNKKVARFQLNTENLNANFENKNKPRSTSVSTTVTDISNSTIGYSPNEPGDLSQSENPRLFYHSISELDLYPTLPEVFEDLAEDEDPDVTIREENVQDELDASLDNTSMENTFWEERLKEKRDIIHIEKDVKVWGRELDEKRETKKTGHLEQTDFANSETSNEQNTNDEASPGVQKVDYKNFYYCTRL